MRRNGVAHAVSLILSKRSASKDARFGREPSSLQMNILVIDCEVVDAAVGRRDPGRHLAGLDHLLHQALHEAAVALARQPLARALLPRLAADDPAFGRDRYARPGADRAAEAGAPQAELPPHASLLVEP